MAKKHGEPIDNVADPIASDALGLRGESPEAKPPAQDAPPPAQDAPVAASPPAQDAPVAAKRPRLPLAPPDAVRAILATLRRVDPALQGKVLDAVSALR